MAFQTGENVWGSYADQAARKNGIDPRLFRALITQESAWNPNAASHAGARGLTQVVPRWHPNADLSTPQSQIDYGAKHFGSLLRKYGNPRDALAVYNSGRPWATSQRFGETRTYVTKILGGLGNVTASTGQTMGGTQPAQAPPPTVGFQAPTPNPQSLADLKAYMALSEKLVLNPKAALENGRFDLEDASNWPDNADATIQRIATRRASAPPQVGRQVATDALQNLGGAAMPGGEFQGIASDGAQTAIQAASQRIGTPYSWGGGTPSGPGRGFGRGANTVGFDCSSLVQYAWAKAGVKLPRTTYEQIKVGTAVPNISQARPGDLLFPHAGPVQMYLGNGKAIEAPFTGGRVRIVPVQSKYLAIRRPA